jgi:TonB-linked SusC/RagA family outer membrane protein
MFKIGTQNQITFYDQDVRVDPLNTGNKLSPLEDAFDASGNVVPLVNNNKTVNPLMDEQDNNFENNVITNRIFTSAYLEFKPIQDLTFRSIVGVTNTNVRNGFFASPMTVSRNNTQALTTYTNTMSLSLNMENILTYKKKIGEHNLTVTAIQSVLRNKGETHTSSGQNQLLASQGFYGLENASVAPSNLARYTESALLSYTGRILYDYKEKYLFTLTGRSDGASQLSPGKKWAFFPSVSAAWRVIEEDFMSDNGIFSDMKVRASYGTSGNYAVAPFATQSTLVRMPFAYDEKLSVGYPISNTLGNDDLGWEISTTVNAAIDFGLLQNRITGTVDLFKTRTEDLLLSRSLPPTSGFAQTTQNIGETETKGVEIGLNAMVIDKKDFSWRLGASWFQAQEKIVALATGSNDIASGWFIGHPVSVFYDYEKLGIWQTDEADQALLFSQQPGQIKVKDQNVDGVINTTDDRIVLGQSRPKWNANLTTDLKYKNFDLNFQVFARWGQMINYSFAGVYDPTANENSIKHDYWTPENPTNEYPRPNSLTSASATPYLSTVVYRDGSFAKLRGITLGFNFPQTLLAKTPFTRARIYVNGKNLWTYSKIDNYDPERGGAQTTPLSRLMVAGINLEF